MRAQNIVHGLMRGLLGHAVVEVADRELLDALQLAR